MTYIRHCLSPRYVLLALACLLVSAQPVEAKGSKNAKDTKVVKLRASGNVVSVVPCSPTEVCQEAQIAGQATVLGRFTGVLFERVTVADGSYTGSGVFTTSDGSTLTTEYVGQFIPVGTTGSVVFFEEHVLVDATGRFAGDEGTLSVFGTADAQGKLSIVGLGKISK